MSELDALASEYVELVLAAGEHDANLVDAYYGPDDRREAVRRAGPEPVGMLRERCRDLLRRVEGAAASDRREFLVAQSRAVQTLLRRLAGERLGLDEESRLTYDITPPSHGVEVFRAARESLEELLPGDGPLPVRLRAFRAGFIVPSDRLEAVVDRALAITRSRTLALADLPPDERFEVSYVRDRPWSAYNWYQGAHASRIEVNVDLPVEIAPILRTLAHEGYPGHHTYNVLLESRLVEGRGWPEFQVHPLFSPQSLLAEGTANVGLSVILDADEEWTVIREELAPVAGLSGRDWPRYLGILDAARPLRFVRGEAARLLLDRGATDEEVTAFVTEHGLQDPSRAAKAVAFIRTYRSYVFNYTAGEDLVLDYLGDGEDRAARFFDLLQRPAIPSALRPPT
jgi:hypothetical protein